MSSNSVHWRYRLNENEELDNKSVEGVILSKEWTKLSLESKPQLEKYIRSKLNPNGIVDYEQVIPEGGKIIRSSKELFEKELKMYTIEQLTLMKRPELVDVGSFYGITSINKTNDFLIKLILKAQSEYSDQAETLPTITEIRKIKDLENIKKRKSK
jgi:hypothetical protein